MKREINIYKIKAYEIIATITIFLTSFKVLNLFSLTWIDVFTPLFIYITFVLYSILYAMIFWR